jgi:hypothetical protein
LYTLPELLFVSSYFIYKKVFFADYSLDISAELVSVFIRMMYSFHMKCWYEAGIDNFCLVFRYNIEQEQKLALETTVLVEQYTVSIITLQRILRFLWILSKTIALHIYIYTIFAGVI